MKQSFSLSVALAITLSAAVLSTAKADDSAVNTKFYFGGKTIKADAWRAQDGHGVIGLLTNVDTGFHGIRVAIDLFGAGSEDKTTSDVKGTYTAEAHLGFRKYCELQTKLKPYVGAGVNLVYATQENDDGLGRSSDEDSSVGLWLNGGIDYLVTENITLGVDLRYATSKVELYYEPVKLNALATGVSLGYRW